MNRTIKFRGKRIDTGKWVYGYLVAKNAIRITIEDDSVGYFSEDDIEVDPKTVGQFTGLFDKNGKDIYENDIVNSGWSGNTSEICFGEYVLIFEDREINAIGFYWKNESFCFGLDVEQGTLEYEVLGNIHDNPELLTESK